MNNNKASLAFCRVAETFFTYLLTVFVQAHRCDANSVILKPEVGSQHASLSTSGWKNCDLSKKDPFCKMFAFCLTERKH